MPPGTAGGANANLCRSGCPIWTPPRAPFRIAPFDGDRSQPPVRHDNPPQPPRPVPQPQAHPQPQQQQALSQRHLGARPKVRQDSQGIAGRPSRSTNEQCYNCKAAGHTSDACRRYGREAPDFTSCRNCHGSHRHHTCLSQRPASEWLPRRD